MRRARVRTELDRADLVAAALRPDDTPEMETRVEGEAVVTDIERETTGGLRSTVDDYLVNLDVARRTIANARRHGTNPDRHGDTDAARHGDTS